MELYYFADKNLEEAGAELGLSKSWACRLHARAVDLLRRAMDDARRVEDAATGATSAPKRRACAFAPARRAVRRPPACHDRAGRRGRGARETFTSGPRRARRARPRPPRPRHRRRPRSEPATRAASRRRRRRHRPPVRALLERTVGAETPGRHAAGGGGPRQDVLARASCWRCRRRVFRYSQAVEVVSRATDKLVGAVKQTMGTQV